MVSRPLNVNREVSFDYGFMSVKIPFFMLINESELSKSTNEYIAQQVEVTDIIHLL